MNVHVVLLKCLLKSPLRVIKFTMHIPFTKQMLSHLWSRLAICFTECDKLPIHISKEVQNVNRLQWTKIGPIVSAE